MDQMHFSAVARTLTEMPSRRDVLRGLGAAGLGLGGLRLPDLAMAKKRRKKKGKKPKKPKPNAFGCLNVGQPCNGDSTQCCSGICEGTAPKKGKKDSSRCVAHDTGICRGPASDTCSTGAAHACNSAVTCACLLTTGNGGFCGDGGRALCQDCSRDSDCEEELGDGAACVVLGGICEDLCPDTGGTACVPPCPDVAE